MSGESIEDKIIVADCVLVVAENIHEETYDIQSTPVLTRLIIYNDSKLCDVLTNAIFLLLTILLLGCIGYVIAFCIDPRILFRVFGIDEELTNLVQNALKNQ